MNTEAILIVVTSVTIFMFLMGTYKVVLERKVKARERVQEVISGASGGVVSAPISVGLRASNKNLLKKRKKDDEKLSFIDKVDQDLERANLLIKTTEFLMICLATGVAGVLVSWLVFQLYPLLAVLIGVPCLGLPIIFLKLKILLRTMKAEEQFADVLDTMVNSFKTGFGFNRAVQQIAENFDDPWGTEFAKMSAEMNLGANQESALYSLAKRLPLPDVQLFVTALIIQKETGGNMAELLSILSNTCRDRFKLKRKVAAISAQGKLSAGIICCVPFFLMGVIYTFLPEPVMKFVSNPIGIVIMVVMGTWMAFGIGILFKIAHIEV